MKRCTVLLAQSVGTKRVLGQAASAPKGLLGLEHLRGATDFRSLAAAGMVKCQKLREEVIALGDSDPNTTLLLLDRISNEVCSVIDVAEFCRNVHENAAFRKEAEDAFETLSSFIHGLNGDETLYQKLRRIVDTDAVFRSLDREYQLFALDLKAEFEVDGIHLPERVRERANALQAGVVAAETRFTQNAARDDTSGNFVLGPFPSPAEHRRFSKWLEPYVPQPPTLPPLHVVSSSHRRIAGALLKSLDDEALRRTVWTKSMLEPAANVRALGELMKSRQELARLLGYESFAHKFLANKASKTPEEVGTFLEEVAAAGRPQAQAELASLTDLKRALTASSSAALQPWDIAYLTNVALSSEQPHAALAHSGQRTAQAVSRGQAALAAAAQYFPLRACVEGLAGITLALFGLRARFTDVPAAESWRANPAKFTPSSSFSFSPSAAAAASASADAAAAFGAGLGLADLHAHTVAAGVLKCDVSGPDGEAMGTVYLDLFQRPNKFPGAAHFTLRCGCSNTDGFQAGDGARIGSSSSAAPVQYQLPIVALSFSFAAQAASSDPLLSLHDVETLHHEWGHALHSLLSRTTFQHLSGTRGALDFVEVPSHLFEHFARCPAVLAQWARHHATGSRPPPGLLEEALHAKQAFAAVEQQNQLLYSLADQHLFGAGICDLAPLSPEHAYCEGLAGVAALQRRLTDLPLGHVSGVTLAGRDVDLLPNMPFPSHGHFVNYGGGYYAYVFAKIYAARIWDAHFAQDPLSRRGGDVLWHRMLQYGAGRDSREILSDLVS